MEYTLQELANKVGGRIIGDSSIKIMGVAGLKEAGPGYITFISNPKYNQYLQTSKASALIAQHPESQFNGQILLAEDPYLAFAMVLEIFNPPQKSHPGIHPTALIAEGAEIGTNACIQAFAVIEKGAIIGSGTKIMSGVFVGENSCIGELSSIYPNVTIYPKSIIGKSVIIHAGSVIGSDGFGYVKKDGLPYKVPQTGGVIIEDDCEIGANVTIDRGTIGNTTIGKGTKIDNLVQIGHNVIIGPYSTIVSQTGISGSTQIGKGVTLAGQVGVAGHLKIGDGVIAAAKSGITKDIEAGEVISGTMAMPINKWRRSEAIYRNLPEMQKEYRAILKRLAVIEEQLKTTDR